MRLRVFAVVLFGSCVITPSVGQQNQQPTSSQTSNQTKVHDESEPSQRTLGVLPRFGVTNEKNPPALPPKQKFHLFYRSAFDPTSFVISGLEAGVSQATDSFQGYGQGASGYAKRFGASFGDQLSSNFFTNFAYPVLLKEDPRYFRLGEGSVKHRFAYATAQEFVGHKDNGGRTFNWSNTLGALTAGSISNAYYPSDSRGFGLTMGRAGLALLYGSLGGLGNEFWPDVARKLHRKTQRLPPDDQSQK